MAGALLALGGSGIRQNGAVCAADELLTSPLLCDRGGVRGKAPIVRAVMGTGFGLAAIACSPSLAGAVSAAGSATATARAAAVTDQPPAQLSDAEIDRIPVRSYSYSSPTSSGSTVRAASGKACRLYAFDPYTRAPSGTQKTRVVVASGWQACALGIGQRTQACLYKRHKILIFNRWVRTRCGRETFDRRPTFRPAATAKFCVPKGAGRWRTVVFGSIYYNGPLGPSRYFGAVRSDDKTFENCN